MRVFGRLLYALLVVGFFLLTFQFSIMQMRDAYYEDVFGQSLTDEDSTLPDYYYFYASLPDYHKEDPLISIDEDGYEIRAYEIARASIEDDTLSVDENLFFIVYHPDSEKLLDLDRLRIVNGNTAEQIDIYLGRYHGLDVLVSIDPQTSYYLVEKESIDFSLNYTHLQMIDYDNEAIIESAFNLSEDDFTIQENLQTFYNDYESLPTEDDLDQLMDRNIYPKEQNVTTNYYVVDKYIHILGIWMGVYFIALIFTTYFIFFKKKKRQTHV